MEIVVRAPTPHTKKPQLTRAVEGDIEVAKILAVLGTYRFYQPDA